MELAWAEERRERAPQDVMDATPGDRAPPRKREHRCRSRSPLPAERERGLPSRVDGLVNLPDYVAERWSGLGVSRWLMSVHLGWEGGTSLHNHHPKHS